MRIRRLRLAGFKSFVEPAELRIEPGLTGVVGPNGCGKSNLLEAMRWAMGEGSPKSLRGGGMEDVIFAGTARRPARDFAEVSILLEDDADSEREVVRRIERGAGSAYRLDGRDVRQRDVALLFADAATGAHSPALVSQGRIAAVIAARPAERRQMLEEAAGIAGLHVRRKDAEQRLRATEANLETLDGLLREMEVRAQALRRQARQAERYRQLSDAIRLTEARMIFARWRDAAVAAEAARAEMERAEGAVASASEAQRAAAAAAAGAATALAEARGAAQRAGEAAAETARRRATLTGERDAAVRRLAELERQAAAILGDRAREDRLAVDATGALDRLVAEEQTLSEKLAQNEPRRAPLEAAVGEAERAAHTAELALEHALARVAAERAETRIAAAALEEARRGLTRAQADADRLVQERFALPDPAAADAVRETAGRALAEAQAEAAEACRTVAAAEQARATATDARAAAQREQAAAQAALAALEAERRALDQAQSRATGAGVLARISVTPGCERALAAALGDDLDAALGGDGARRWAGAAPRADDPALPAGVRSLAAEVSAPPELARRLAQVGVVERDDGGIPLTVGQRLVTLAGGLRRWDGFVSRDPDAAAEDRLVRANRLAEVERALDPARAAAARAAAELGQAGHEVSSVEAEVSAARQALAGAEDRERTAVRAEDAAIGAAERASAQAEAVVRRAGPVEAELERARVAVVTAEQAVLALPATEAAEVETARLRTESGGGQAALADARARLVRHERELGEARRRLDAVRAEARGWRARAGEAAGRVREMADRAAAIDAERESLVERPATLADEIAAGESAECAAAERATAARSGEAAAETALRNREADVASVAEALATAREARAGAAARAEAQELRRVELGRVAGERFQCPAPVLPERLGFSGDSVGEAARESQEHERLTGERERIGPVNLVAADELVTLEAERATSAAEQAELREAVNRLRGSIGSLNREGRQRLQAAFAAVDGHFRRLFTGLFAGGEAHLALVDADDPLEAGLEIMAQPPGKKLAALTLLSGGEQALTAVALIFALFLTNPAPICVLDEVDAPLDDANIERFCDLLDRMTQETETRYLIVTHNPVTMSRMHRLFGVTMIEQGVSRLVSVDLESAGELLAAE